MGLRILLIEDDAEICEFVARGLREEGHRLTTAADGQSGLQKLMSSVWDVVLLDWWLPLEDGLSVLRNFRQRNRHTPVLFRTARDAVSDRVRGLDAGANDYLCKPFAFEELLARIRALARTHASQSVPTLSFSDVQVDLATQRVERAGCELELTGREYALLVYLMQHPHAILSRSEIYSAVWDAHYDGLSNTLEVHVMELRKKLEAFGPRLIHTLRHRGYMLAEKQGSKLDAD